MFNVCFCRFQNKVKELRLRRQQLRTDILEAAKDVRKQKLMVASCDWVDPDTLDRRIEEALDTPEPLNRIIVGATK